MRVKKRPAKRRIDYSESIEKPNKRCNTLEEAIERRQKSFRGKKIFYLDTKFSNGKYKNFTVEDVIRKNRQYVAWYITIANMYVTDEVTNKMNEI